MLTDSVRIEAYKKAISEIVRDDHIVVEIGSGLGTYSFFAAEAGAKRVYAIEAGPVIEVSRSIAGRNSLLDRVSFIKGNSTDVELPEKADVLIFEDFGPFFVGEQLGAILRDATDRFLNSGRVIIPAEAELHISLLGDERIYKDIDSMSRDDNIYYGIDFSPTKPLAMDSCYTKKIPKDALLSTSELLTSFKLLDCKDFAFKQTVSLVADKGTIYGIVGWFNLKLSDNTTLSNDPSNPSTCWEQVVFPVETPLTVRQNEEINVEIKCLQSDSGGEVWITWQIETEKYSYNGSTFKGEPLSIDDIKKRDRRFVPSATENSNVLLFILEQINGQSTNLDISKKLFERFPGRFKSIDEAYAIVCKVVTEHVYRLGERTY